MSAFGRDSRHASCAWRRGENWRSRMRAPAGWILCTALATAACAVRSRPVFHGDWRVILFTAPGVADLRPTEAAGWIGTVATFDSRRAVFGRETCEAPSYATRTMTPDEFATEFRVRPSDVGIGGDWVTKITVTCPTAWSNLGSVLLVKSRDALFTVSDGVFFELERRTPR